MYVPMPFPKCFKCGNSGSQGYHRNCGGALEIDPLKEIVYCPKCSENWKIWDTTYYCTCGNEYTSNDIYDTTKELLAMCNFCLKEIEAQQKAKNLQKRLSKNSIRSFLVDIFERLGYLTGIAIGTIIDTVTKLLFN